MAAENSTITLNNGYPVPTGPPTTPTGGSWPAGTYSYLVTANYEGDLTYDDSQGWPLTPSSDLFACVVAANDQVVISWAHADPQPISYEIWYQSGATFDLGVAATHAGSVAGSLATITITAPDDSALITLPAAYPVVTLQKTAIAPGPRDLLERAYNGKTVQKSDALRTMFSALAISLSGMSCSASDYRKLLRWARLNVRLAWADGDAANCELASATGRITVANSLNSDHKQSGHPSLQFVVDGETYTTP